jgi:hypothetical protein
MAVPCFGTPVSDGAMPACQTACYRLQPTHIHFLRFVLEGYEGLGLLTTLDPERGVVRLSIAPGCEADLGELMRALASEVPMEPCDGPREVREGGSC